MRSLLYILYYSCILTVRTKFSRVLRHYLSLFFPPSLSSISGHKLVPDVDGVCIMYYIFGMYIVYLFFFFLFYPLLLIWFYTFSLSFSVGSIHLCAHALSTRSIRVPLPSYYFFPRISFQSAIHFSIRANGNDTPFAFHEPWTGYPTANPIGRPCRQFRIGMATVGSPVDGRQSD